MYYFGLTSVIEYILRLLLETFKVIPYGIHHNDTYFLSTCTINQQVNIAMQQKNQIKQC